MLYPSHWNNGEYDEAIDAYDAALAAARGRGDANRVMPLVRFAPGLWRLICARGHVLALVLLFLLDFLVMRDVSCVRHGDSIKKTFKLHP